MTVHLVSACNTAKELTKKDTKDAKILALTTHLSKLDKSKTSILETVQGGGGNINVTRINTKGRDLNKISSEGLNNT